MGWGSSRPALNGALWLADRECVPLRQSGLTFHSGASHLQTEALIRPVSDAERDRIVLLCDSTSRGVLQDGIPHKGQRRDASG